MSSSPSSAPFLIGSAPTSSSMALSLGFNNNGSSTTHDRTGNAMHVTVKHEEHEEQRLLLEHILSSRGGGPKELAPLPPVRGFTPPPLEDLLEALGDVQVGIALAVSVTYDVQCILLPPTAPALQRLG